MYEIHENVFKLFYDKYLDEGWQFKFSLRKSNRYDRLLHGHWFYGNDDYAAISFWSGSDWKNKTPNIFFGIDKNGWTFLELSATDSEKKQSFFHKVLANSILELTPFKNGWRKYYSSFEGDYMQSLKTFLIFEKVYIDTLIRNETNSYFTEEDTSFNRIGFITNEDFEKKLLNVLRYRNTFNPKNIRKKLPEHIKSFSLKMSFPKINVSFTNLPSNAQWIFFTGMNGTGKTNILKGIASAIVDNYDNYYLINDGTFNSEISINRNNRIINREIKLEDTRRKRMLKGFAAYGASRQTIVEFPEGENFNHEEFKRKSTSTYSLFHTDGLLFNIDAVFLDFLNRFLPQEVKPITYDVNYLKQIIDLLPEIIPTLVEIRVPQASSIENLWSHIEYVEEDENGDRLPPAEFSELSSGAKSLIAMFGDMLIRLYRQQPDVQDFSELSGVVLIDEIDVHLHPNNQRLLVEKLTGLFPKIQFIVTTHSPIPLLGAPKDSIFFKVERNAKEGICVKRLEQLEKEIKNLLPNAIYTSDIFELDNIVSVQNEIQEQLDTSENYSDYDLDKILAEQIGRIKRNSDDDEFLKFLKNEEN